MELKKEIVNAFQLVLLLCLLFWSFTWNFPKDQVKPSTKFVKKFDVLSNPNPSIQDKHSIVLDSFKNVRYAGAKVSKVPADGDSVLLPFDTWKKEELNRDVKNEEKPPSPITTNGRRKLNFASSKCGAKILSSNEEARYQASILNEKVDEYMLNPCAAKAWFVVELCDAIQATQIEIANYELYSSSPRGFSTYWSEVYPALVWNHIGTFEPRDTRTVQTFDLRPANLGKFIKVLISGHHGKEHFCPLSVVRVLGYSMVYEYEDGHGGTRKDKNDQMTDKRKGAYSKPINGYYSSLKDGGNIFTMCSKDRSDSSRSTKTCCILEEDSPLRYLLFPLKKQETEKTGQGKSCDRKSHTNSILHRHRNITTVVTKPDRVVPQLQPLSSNKSENGNIDCNSIEGEKRCSIPKSNVTTTRIQTSTNNSSQQMAQSNTMKNDQSFHRKYGDLIEGRDKTSGCVCNDDVTAKNSKTLTPHGAHREELSSRDSAALIQKESVLVKLNLRIRESEKNMLLINKYLQRLSEYYRLQMDDMKNMFNGTINALQTAATKAIAIDEAQQVSIDSLERNVNSLNAKVANLGAVQKELLQRVVELHGFFLILEIIVMSTIFSVFVNKFKSQK